jgi:cytochrome P450
MGDLTIDAYDPDIIECPWSTDRALRAEAPVYYDSTNDIYLVSSYALIDRVIKDPAQFSSRYMEKFLGKELPPPEVLEIYAQGFPIVDALLVTDGPLHHRHRKIITKAFSRARLDELAPRFADRIAALFAGALAKGGMAFRADLADAVPMIMTQEQLRIPAEDMPQVIAWSHQLSAGFGGGARTLDEMKQDAREIVRFQRYFEARLLAEMKQIEATGKGTRDDDLLTMLAQAILNPDDPMDMAEALSFLFNLLPATHDTTTAAMTACMHRYVADAGLQARLAAQPDLIPKFVDEAMRHESPIRGFWRRANEDCQLAGVAVPAGSWLLLRVASANRDEEAFDRADTLDIDRRVTKPNLSFGTGIHTCAGRMFARHIIIAVFAHLSKHAKNFRFSDEQTDFSHEINLLVAPFRELHLTFEAMELTVTESAG